MACTLVGPTGRPGWLAQPQRLDGRPVHHAPWLWLGTHQVHWLRTAGVPLFVSRRRLQRLRPQSWPQAATWWAMDSGGFTELRMHGGWVTTPREYVDLARQAAETVGSLAWIAPMDWMCEPDQVARTAASGAAAAALGRSTPRGVRDHLELTVRNFVQLRTMLDRPGDPLVIPVVQGWTLAEYEQCLQLYARAGVDLAGEPLVGVGSVCRRDQTAGIIEKIAWLGQAGLTRLHAFGVKGTALTLAAHRLSSADSLAWSYNARRKGRPVVAGHTHAHCGNCQEAALAWRSRALGRMTSSLTALHAGLAVVEGWIADGSWRGEIVYEDDDAPVAQVPGGRDAAGAAAR